MSTEYKKSLIYKSLDDYFSIDRILDECNV